jgi:FkbM family methyltransferase
MDLIQREYGFWWPADDAWCYKVIHQEVGDADLAIGLTKGRTLAVQAGGNVGVWAAYLAKRFERVVTVEPDATNYECLKRNVPANVERQRAAFGSEPGWINLTRVDGNAGAHYADTTRGDIPRILIDELNLPACDLLILDVEGSEPDALYGAEQTIRKFRPVVMFEEKGLSERYYGIKRGMAETWLKGLGYTVRAKVRADVVMAHG